jgi:hypothetical protein|nr:MAG TPA: hypothetical protein [Caudoviricetes sp.]
MSIGDGRRTYSDSTLKSMTKDELIDIIRCLENNLRNAHETNDIQYENCKRLLAENGVIEDESFDKKIEEQTVTWIKLGLALSEEEKEELAKLCEQYARL